MKAAYLNNDRVLQKPVGEVVELGVLVLPTETRPLIERLRHSRILVLELLENSREGP
jgi:hypothetical protein